MRYTAVLFLVLGLLSGCASNGGTNANLAGTQTTNDVATTNLNLGIEYMRAGNMESALDRLKRALDADPGYFGTHNALGLLYQRLGEPALAERHFKRAIALNPGDSGSKNNYALFLCQSNRFDEAEKTFLAAIANPLYETPAAAYSNAGTCALMDKRTADAENFFRRALTINPQIPAALLQMAQISYDQDNYLNARGYLQRYQSVAQHTPASLLLGIRIERQLGDRNAVASYELLLKNNFGDSIEASQINSPASR